jgi:hypothetical protein
MALRKGDRIDRGYATVAEDDGDNYREIAEVMTVLGFRMNHSSARNYVIRVMRKFVEALTEDMDRSFTDQQIDEIAKDPGFQHGIAELLQTIEARRRSTQ